MTYDADYFIEKFLEIPSRLMCLYDATPDKRGRCCALGHCGMRPGVLPEEAIALLALFHQHGGCAGATNDGNGRSTWNLGQGRKTPRGRILSALRWIKKKEADDEPSSACRA